MILQNGATSFNGRPAYPSYQMVPNNAPRALPQTVLNGYDSRNGGAGNVAATPAGVAQSNGETKKALSQPEANKTNLYRIDSKFSNTSNIVVEAEKIRQRYSRVVTLQIGDGALDDEKDYKTMVHTLERERIAQLFKSKFSPDFLCNEGPCGLIQKQATIYSEVYGENKISPPQKENKWIKLLRLTFCGIFNILLWVCVIAEVSLLLINAPCGTNIQTLGDPSGLEGNGTKQEIGSEGKEEKDADYVTPIILAAVIIMAACLQWYAEQKAEDEMEALQKLQASEPVKVVRRTESGERINIDLDSNKLVPGDVIFVKDGDKIPADVRILHCTDGMEVDNSALTGESIPEPRDEKTCESTIQPAEAKNLAFFGTLVMKGKATCVVHAIGDSTFLGKIAQGIKSSRVKSTLEYQIEHFVHIIAVVAIVVGLLSLLANIFAPTPRCPNEILQNSAAALFAQVPEGLLPTVTICLMITATQMATVNVAVRKIDAVETLGCVSVFCSDKTGTLTKGTMTVQDLVLPAGKSVANDGLKVVVRQNGAFAESQELEAVKRCGILNNGGGLTKDKDGELKWTGNASDIAILKLCTEINNKNTDKSGLLADYESVKFKPENKSVWEIPFNSTNKWMLSIHGDGGQGTLILKGAPDKMYDFFEGGEVVKEKIKKEQQQLMDQARRVLAVGMKQIPMQDFKGTCASDLNFKLDGLQFVALFGIEDPPKERVKEAVEKAHRAHVKVVMITGDHPDTARAIAERISIYKPSADCDKDSDEYKYSVIQGKNLDDKVPKNGADNFGDNEDPEVVEFWKQATTHARVFARVSPIHKQVIVQAFQKFGYNGRGDICAMTGDGVNDAPALKQAEVGIAMNERGNDVTKDAADIILLDDNVESVIKGIEQGRLSSENLQKSIMYTLCSKVPQVAPTFAELLSVPPALTVAQVLLIDIGTDIWTAIAYALQPAEHKLMERPPRHPQLEKLVNWKVLVYSYGYLGPIQMMFCWIMFFFVTPGLWELFRSGVSPSEYTLSDEIVVTQGKTVYYWTLVMGQIAAAISTTTKLQSVFGIFCDDCYGLPNTVLNGMFVGEILLGLAAIYVPFMQSCFDTGALSLITLLIPVSALFGICWIEEVRKKIGRILDEREEDISDYNYDDGSDYDGNGTDGSEDDRSGSDGEDKPLLC